MITAIIVLSVIVFFVVLLFIPIRLKAKVNYNLLVNEGIISCKVYGLRLILAKIIFKGKYIVVIKDNKAQAFWLKSQGDESIKDAFIMEIIKRFKFVTMKAYGHIGYADSPLITGMGVGLINEIIICALGVIHIKKLPRKIDTGLYPAFDENKLIVSASMVISINLFDIIASYISVLIKHKKESVNNGQRVSSK